MKRWLVGDKLLELDYETLDYMYIDDGNEADVYRYGNDALKIYKKYCRKTRLSLDDAKFLSVIPTSRFLMPKEMIYDADSGDFIGYSTDFIYKYPKNTMLRSRVHEFLSELNILNEDLSILANYGVEVYDVHIDNVLYNGKIFIGDPGSFLIHREIRGEQIYRRSTYELSKLVLDDVFGMVPLSKKKRRNFNNNFFESEYIGYQIEDTAEPLETVRQYVRRMTR